MTSYGVALLRDCVRLDVYGEVQEAGRIAAMLSREEAMALSKELAMHALKLPETKFNPEDLV